MKNWFVVYTQPRNEDLASEHLGRQGFDVYFPAIARRGVTRAASTLSHPRCSRATSSSHSMR